MYPARVDEGRETMAATLAEEQAAIAEGCAGSQSSEHATNRSPPIKSVLFNRSR